MFIDHNLKKLFTVGASLLSLGLAAFPATAKDSAKSCLLKNEAPVIQVDENTIICRTVVSKDGELRIEDKLSLYRYCRRKDLGLKFVSNSVFITFYSSGNTDVMIQEFSQCNEDLQFSRLTGFSLNGRKFDEWLSYAEAIPELMNRYRNDVTRLLNTRDQFPAKPTF